MHSRYLQRTETTSRTFPISPPLSPRLTSVPGELGRGYVPPVFESLPEIRIREASGGEESKNDERASASTPTATPNRSPLCGETTFEPKRIESWWWLSGVSETDR